jgi:hypothetical protein
MMSAGPGRRLDGARSRRAHGSGHRGHIERHTAHATALARILLATLVTLWHVDPVTGILRLDVRRTATCRWS